MYVFWYNNYQTSLTLLVHHTLLQIIMDIMSLVMDKWCNIDLQWSGGTSPYQNWFDGSTTTDTIQSNLSTGIYIDSLVDANGCSYSQSITINEPSALSLNLTTTNLSCYNSCDGRILTQINGGVSSYTFSWSDGSSLDSNTNLCSGMFNITVTDDNGCTISDSSILTQPTEIIINIDSIFDVSVDNGNDGEIYITAAGGMLNYSYSWTGPNGFSSTNEDIMESIRKYSIMLLTYCSQI